MALTTLAPAVGDSVSGLVTLTFGSVDGNESLRQLVSSNRGSLQTAKLFALHPAYGNLFDNVQASLPKNRQDGITNVGIVHTSDDLTSTSAVGDSIGLAALAGFYALAYGADYDVIIATGAVIWADTDFDIELNCSHADLKVKIQTIENAIGLHVGAFKNLGGKRPKCLILLPGGRQADIENLTDWSIASARMQSMGGILEYRFFRRGSALQKYFSGTDDGTSNRRAPDRWMQRRFAWALALGCAAIVGILATSLQSHRNQSDPLPPDPPTPCTFCPPDDLAAKPLSVGDLHKALAYPPLKQEIERLRGEDSYLSNPHCRSRMGSGLDDYATWETDNTGSPRDASIPAPCLTWPEAEAVARFASRLSGKSYTLPTEAQWATIVRQGKAVPGRSEWLAGCKGAEPCNLHPSGQDDGGKATVEQVSRFERSEYRVFRLVRNAGDQR